MPTFLTQYFLQKQGHKKHLSIDDFEYIDECISKDLKQGEVLTEAICFSIDSFIRERSSEITPIDGFQVARIVESKNGNYPKGCLVLQETGWRTMSISNDDLIWFRVDNIYPKIDVLHALGVVGLPGLTAYFGLLNICRPQPGETVMITSCAGPVGIIAGQIARLKGCKVIGCCGNEKKVKYAKSVGFDKVLNYKKVKDWSKSIKKMAEEGIDCFFDNVGGQLASVVISNMSEHGRVACCGFSSRKKQLPAEAIQPAVVLKSLKLEGFTLSLSRDRDKFPRALRQLAVWKKQGKIKYEEVIFEGFLNLPTAYAATLKEENMGRTVVRLPLAVDCPEKIRNYASTK